ncbi:hypothetical protein FRC20_008056 [Serendipita sp. 405]|nr:hypothetical protein FRC16_006895 [Serendipita sp. 398]KAG8831863.1 hypothetical protein FRC20_008056 [Serendipita sp. 405]
MHSLPLLVIIAGAFVSNVALAVPFHDAILEGNRLTNYGNGLEAARIAGQAAMASSSTLHPRNVEPLPRVVSRRNKILPNDHIPADLGAVDDDAWTRVPRQLPEQVVESLDAEPVEKRHDRVNSPQALNSGSCNVGEAQCCQSIHQSGDKKGQFLTSLLSLAIPAEGTMLGVQCTPIANLLPLTGSETCHSQPVCCTGNEYHGLVNVGCSPLSL